MHCISIYSNWASILHTTFGGWVPAVCVRSAYYTTTFSRKQGDACDIQVNSVSFLLLSTNNLATKLLRTSDSSFPTVIHQNILPRCLSALSYYLCYYLRGTKKNIQIFPYTLWRSIFIFTGARGEMEKETFGSGGSWGRGGIKNLWFFFSERDSC